MSRAAALEAAIASAIRDRASYAALSPSAKRELAQRNLRARQLNRPEDVRSPHEFVLESQLLALQSAAPEWDQDESLLARVERARPQVQKFGDEMASHLVFLRNARIAIDGDYGKRTEATKLDAQISTLASRFEMFERSTDLEQFSVYDADLTERVSHAGERMARHQLGPSGAAAERQRIADLPESQKQQANTSNEGATK